MPRTTPPFLERRTLSGALFVLVSAAAMAAPVSAQQFVVDDAGIAEAGACQLEAWVSAGAGWLLPACTPAGRAEFTLGVGYVEGEVDNGAHREVEFVLQAKVQIVADDPGAVGLAVVTGAGLGPFAQAAGVPLEGFYGYIPLTYTLADERAQLHLNAGWAHYREGGIHRGLYGGRADVALHQHVIAIGELFGEGEDVGLQVGFRVAAIPERLVFDASYGEALTGATPPIGFALGVAWTPPPFYTPLR